jgi:autotransporter strand-loop-strand O-heptosyltransferase
MKCKVTLKSYPLGDTIAAIPQVSKFQKLTGYEVGLFMTDRYKSLFEKVYTNITFNPENFSFKKNIDIDYYSDRPLQKGYADDLGIEYKEEIPKVYVPENLQSPFPKKKYITLSMQSTHQGRYWNNKNGWDFLIKYLKQKYNIHTVCIDRYPNWGIKNHYNLKPKKAIDRTGISLDKCVEYINNSLFHVGVSTGLSWLAHACGKHVVLISNVTKHWHEFTYNVTRIYDESICHGCLNEEQFDNSNWLWCPRKKNFECTKKISFSVVKEKIDNLIQDHNL